MCVWCVHAQAPWACKPLLISFKVCSLNVLNHHPRGLSGRFSTWSWDHVQHAKDSSLVFIDGRHCSSLFAPSYWNGSKNPSGDSTVMGTGKLIGVQSHWLLFFKWGSILLGGTKGLGILRGAVGLESDRNFAVDDKKDGHQMIDRPSEQSLWHWNGLKSSPFLKPFSHPHIQFCSVVLKI